MKKRGLLLLLILCSLPFMNACGKAVEEEVITLSKEDKSISYVTVNPAYEDLILDQTVDCKYMQSVKYDLSFGLTAVPIEEIYVTQGELVKKGQILASLNLGDWKGDIANLEYELANSQLKYEQTKQLKDYDLEAADKICHADWEHYSFEKEKKRIEKEYRKDLEALEDEITITTAKLAELKKKVEKGVIYSPCTGMVTYVLNSELGRLSNTTDTVVTVSELSGCYFKSNDVKYKDYFTEGEVYQMKCLQDGDYSSFYVTPNNIGKWESNGYMTFMFTDSNDFVTLGTPGSILINTDEKLNILCVPTNAIHDSESKKFVYVLEDGIRQMKYVTIGVSGNGKTEILSGLTQKDMVILEQVISTVSSEESEENAVVEPTANVAESLAETISAKEVEKSSTNLQEEGDINEE